MKVVKDLNANYAVYPFKMVHNHAQYYHFFIPIQISPAHRRVRGKDFFKNRTEIIELLSNKKFSGF